MHSKWRIHLTLLAVALTLAACGGENGADGTPGSLVIVEPEPEGDNCPAGGRAIHAGQDLDGDGLLSEAEYASTSYVCDGAPGSEGAPGTPPLVRLSEFPPSPNSACPQGGTRIDAGVDADLDGALDANEITSTQIICDGDDGAQPIVRMSDEAPGADCLRGGSRYEVGLDDNNDGVLADDEVDFVDFVCNGGEVAVRTSRLADGDVACPAGGVLFESGLDLDGDGLLIDDEVEDGFTLCDPHVTLVSAGTAHACAQLNTGQVHCWGRNTVGQLGRDPDQTLADASPVPLPPLNLDDLSIIALAPGGGHTCALTTDSAVQCWGQNTYGQIGLTPGQPAAGYQITPVTITDTADAPLAGVIDLASARHHSCAATTDGAVHCWGWNNRGQLGDDRADGIDLASRSGQALTVIDDATDAPLGGIDALALGEFHSCALRNPGDNGRVLCWGNNDQGQLGVPLGSLTDDVSTAAVQAGLSGVTAVAAGQNHTCAITLGGAVYCWGHNDLGQLGDDAAGPNTEVPTAVLLDDGTQLTNAAALFAGLDHTCALTLDGAAWCWGDNSHGQLGVDAGATPSSATPVAVGVHDISDMSLGSGFTCALRHGRALCWGLNAEGQLGNGGLDTAQTPTPLPLP